MKLQVDKEECVVYTNKDMIECFCMNNLFKTCDMFKDIKLVFDCDTNYNIHFYRCDECKKKGGNLIVEVG